MGSNKNQKTGRDMRKILMLGAIVALVALAACGTVEGMGRDISGGAQRVGDWLN
jgi:predicted small secreted protein